MNLSVIIVNYKNPNKTVRCINSIKKSDLAGLEYEIIVVDNYSEDKSEKIIKKSHSDILFFQTEKNLGMGGGNNSGLKKVSGDYVLIANDDIVFEPDSIKKMKDFLKKNKDVGIVAPKIKNPDGSLQQNYFRFPPLFYPFFQRTFLGKNLLKKSQHDFLMKDFDGNSIKNVDWIMGSCFLTTRDFWKKVGLFDKRFFMYLEDTDLCRRAWLAGFRVVYYPESTVIHEHGRGSAKGRWYLAPFKNKLARAHIVSWLKYFWKWKFKRKI